MIDGIKIYLPYLNYLIWTNNILLDFHYSINVNTGEIVGTRIAKYWGLEFRIKPSKKYKGQYICEIVGSLHRYHNKGRHNDNDFTFADLQLVLKDLKQKFNVIAPLAQIQNIEFGVNIHTPVTVKKFTRNLVVCGTDELATINNTTKAKIIGKQVLKTQYRYKVYDKGYTASNGQKNLLRVEYKTLKMETVRVCGIKTLTDLTNKTKVGYLLKKILFKYDQFIYWDKDINRKKLTFKQGEKYQYYGNATNWLDFKHHKQRQRAKQQYKTLLTKASTSTTFTDVRTLIIAKWNELLGKGTTLQKPNKTDQKRHCVCCGANINHKQKGAKYCSKKCNNKVNKMRATQQKQYNRKQQQKQLNKLLEHVPKDKLWLWVSYKNEGVIYTDHLHQNEINTTKNWIKTITTVSVKTRKNAKPIVLTTVRAKQLIKFINNYNLKNGIQP